MTKYKITIETSTPIEYITGKLKVNCKVLDVENVKETLSGQQMKSIHLWLGWIADECNEKGITMQMLLSKRMEIKPTKILLKESFWRVAQQSMFGKKSTTQLFKTKEINDIVDVINLYISELTKGEVIIRPFPDWKKIDEEEYK